MDRRNFISAFGAASVGVPLACSDLLSAEPVEGVFTPKYRAIRARFLESYERHGQIVAFASGKRRRFSDQTIHMGFALLSFAGEARLLQQAGQDAKPTELILGRILRAFEALDRDAEKERLNTAEPGFFLRDFAKEKDASGKEWWPGHTVESDFLASATKPDEAGMSLDQVVSMMMGWWAVAHWSTDEANKKLAREQAGRVMDFLCRERFMIDRPGTGKPVARGDDARAAAGFLCHACEQITGIDYYGRAKVRLTHDNKCHTCAGSGLVNVPDPNVQCPACTGSGECKIVLGGGRCEACRGSGECKIVTESDCPACRATGEIRIVVTDPFGKDHTLGKSRCGLCHGDGKIGGKTELGKCKVCKGKGRLPQYTKDLGKCKMCGGGGRLKGTLPKAKCPVCGGSKELNLYVRVTHPVVLALEPAALSCLQAPKVGLHKGKVTIDGDNKGVAKSFVRHMNLVCLAFEPAVPDVALLAAAKDSNHSWSVALRAAMRGSVCPTCHGNGEMFVMAPDEHKGVLGVHHPAASMTRHDLGKCPTCKGAGTVKATSPQTAEFRAVLPDLVKLHKECPADGPGDRSPAEAWCKDNRWVRCTDLKRGNGDDHYNGLDFLSMEVLIRLAGGGDKL